MGRARQKYKPRPKVVTDDSELKKIKVDIDTSDKYDSSNALVLPSKKRATKKLRDKNAAPVKLLSKKKRKQLEKIIDQKNKKANHSNLLAALEEVKADPKDLARLTQLQETQTLGRKKYLSDDFTFLNNNIEEDNITERVLSSVKGRKRKLITQEKQEETEDPNIIKLGELSSSSDESEGEDVPVNESDAPRKSTEHNENKVCTELDEPTTSNKELLENKEHSDQPEKKQPEKEEQKMPTLFMSVNRSSEVQEGRLKLPILAEEQSIMEAIRYNPVTVIVGSTGSGKTTQVPQFLYEAGYTNKGKMIGITEPRRVAAISMSKRVAHEMNMTSKEVSYQIRFEGNTTPDTKLKFMTDGVLLKEIQMDPTLKKYSVIIIDEAHERSVFSDILIGILSRIIPRREAKGKPLKLIIMSATLRVEDFTQNSKLFKNSIPPVIKVDARMFDVTIHYNKRTVEDYVGESYKKACKIHRQLPEGGILIFVTGQQEVNALVRKLRATFPLLSDNHKEDANLSAYRKKKLEHRGGGKKAEKKTIKKIVLPEFKLEDFISSLPDDDEGEMVTELDDRDGVGGNSDLDLTDDEGGQQMELKGKEPEQPLWVLPLYSMLPPEKQQMVFQPPPEGMRLCVVATNVAETSLTIPSVKYVVDCGKVKEKIYDKVTGVSMFHVTWTSQASGNQRAGRAGRTAPGHCYRLFSSAVFNDECPKFSAAEIVRRPIDDLVLLMKAMNLPVVNFPFPTPPDYLQVRHAIKRLVTLGALEELPDLSQGSAPLKKRPRNQKPQDLSRITPLGKAMSAFPLAPRYGKMLALSHQHNLLPYTVALVAVLTVPEVLTETPIGTHENFNAARKRWQKVRETWAGQGNSRSLGDVMVLLRGVGAAEYQGGDKEWCAKNGLRHKAVTEIRKLRRQLTNEINVIIPSCNLILDPQMPPPSDEQARLLRQVVLAGSVDHVARRVDASELKTPEDKAKWRHAYRTQEMEEPVFLSASSVLQSEMPQWVIYQEVQETHKMIMRNVTVIEPEWLAIYAPNLCTFSPPLETPEPHYDADDDKIVCHRKASFGAACWELPEVELEFPENRDLYRWVAYNFLLGNICTPLRPFVEHLYEPRTLVNQVAIRFREQRENLLRALMSRKATNLTRLTEIWQKDPKYLQKEYLQWLQNKELKREALRIWPPLCKDTETDWT